MNEKNIEKSKKKKATQNNALIPTNKFGSVFKEVAGQKPLKGFRIPHGLHNLLPMKSTFMWLCLMNLAKSCAAQEISDPFVFFQNGSHYTFFTHMPWHYKGETTGVVWDFFQTIASNINQGKYGEVVPSQFSSLHTVSALKLTICDFLVELTRDSLSPAQTQFEQNVSVNANQLVPDYENECAQLLHDGDVTAGIVLGSVFGGMGLVVLLFVLLYCYCTRKDSYKAIPSPQTKPEQESDTFVTDVDLEKDTTTSYQNSIPMKLSRQMP